MATKKTTKLKCECERCKHKWTTRKDKIPIVCPKCKSPYWNTDKEKKEHPNKKNEEKKDSKPNYKIKDIWR